MGLKNPMLKPKDSSKRGREARKAVAKRRMQVGNGAPSLEYDDGVSKDTGGRGRVKASKAPSLRQRNTTGELWFAPKPTTYRKDNNVRSPW
jgi:hypothetical protein